MVLYDFLRFDTYNAHTVKFRNKPATHNPYLRSITIDHNTNNRTHSKDILTLKLLKYNI